jgi:two-component system, OmpR family, phosphate regulon sensor histidine kinase PhoR
MLQPTPSDPAAEIALLRRQLERERRARRTAEQVCEDSTTQLYDTVQELRSTQHRLSEHLEDQRLVHELSLGLRLDLDPQGIVRRAVSSVGEAVSADRCLVRFADGSGIGRIAEQWTAPDVAPLILSTSLPPVLARLCLDAAGTGTSLVVDDVLTDARLSADQAEQVVGEIGALSYLGTPMWVADRLVGWLVLQSTATARPWTTRHLAVVEGVADALGIALMQAEAHAGQAEALERLREADRVKSELVSTVSHELRTPVTSISGYAQLLLDPEVGALTGEQQRMVEVVRRNSDRLLNLIEDLLALSRADGVDQTEPAPGQVDLPALLDSVHRAMAPLAERRGLDVRLDCPDIVQTVAGSSGQLERVVLNLVSNAVKFTPEGGSVTVSLDQDQDGTLLTVSDTGLGIPQDELPFVFDRFYRASVAIEQAIQGTGLGLAVVRSTVEAHGGTVAIASEPGRGTTVSITLPKVRRAASAARASA